MLLSIRWANRLYKNVNVNERVNAFLFFCSIMLLSNEKNCQRCAKLFICNTSDIANCQCSSVQLTNETRALLSRTQYDCLCKYCLNELNILTEEAEGKVLPRVELLVDGLHYYKENGMLVFTEYYHLLRGYCCGNGCRHCAYGRRRE